MNKKRYYNVDFLRFLFSILIVYFHLLNNNIMPYVENAEQYQHLQKFSPFLSNLVECFLILGGVFLYISEKNNKKPFLITVMDRFFRLWPVYGFYVIIYFLFFNLQVEDSVFNITMLHATGISLNYKGIAWYISPFFWASLLCIAIMRTNKPKKYVVIFAILAYLGCCLNINQTNGSFGREIVLGFISLAFTQCLAVLSIGILLQMFIIEWKKYFSFEQTKLSFIIITIVEIVMISFFIKLLFTNTENKIFQNRFLIIIIFAILLVLLMNEAGAISALLSRPFFGALGKYSYSIYVMQQISFNILSRTLWKNKQFMHNGTGEVLGVSLLFSVLLGIMTHYIIEKPSMSLWERYKMSHLKKQTL